jgi:hypothetical protein
MNLPYTAHEILDDNEDIQVRMNEIKKSLARRHPKLKVTFDLANDYIDVKGLFTLKYTIQ